MILNPVNKTCESPESEPISSMPSEDDTQVLRNNLDLFCRVTTPAPDTIPDFFVVPWLCHTVTDFFPGGYGNRCEIPAAEFYAMEALGAHDQRNFESAACLWNLAIEIDPLEYKFYWGRGVTFENLNLPMLAGADFLFAHELNPSAPEPWLYLGINELNLGAVASAEQYLSEFNATFPENPEGNLYLGILALLGEDPLRALPLFDTALQLDPNLNQARILKGIALVQLERFEESLDSLNRGIQGGANDVQTFLFRGTALARLGRFAEAKNDFAMALAIDPNNPIAGAYYSQVVEDLGR